MKRGETERGFGSLTGPGYMDRKTLDCGSLDIVPLLSLHLQLPPFLWNINWLNIKDLVLTMSCDKASPRGRRCWTGSNGFLAWFWNESLPDLPNQPTSRAFPVGNKEGNRISWEKNISFSNQIIQSLDNFLVILTLSPKIPISNILVPAEFSWADWQTIKRYRRHTRITVAQENMEEGKVNQSWSNDISKIRMFCKGKM